MEVGKWELEQVWIQEPIFADDMALISEETLQRNIIIYQEEN